MYIISGIILGIAVIIVYWLITSRPSQLTTQGLIDDRIVIGGLYTNQGEDGRWRVSKVLAYDRSAVHLRMYTNRFKNCPTHIEPSELTIEMDIDDIDSDDFAIGVAHLPISVEGFLAEEHYYLGKTSVTREELEGELD